jgi:hypothetical protein
MAELRDTDAYGILAAMIRAMAANPADVVIEVVPMGDGMALRIRCPKELHPAIC